MSKNNKIILCITSVVIILILIFIICPMILNSVEQSRYISFNESKDRILKSAENKYSADVSNVSNTITEYTVGELIESGYISKDVKNPLTGKKYDDDTKVIVSNENGKIKLYYISGSTILELVKKLNSKDGIYYENDEYIYKGTEAKNYISFNQEIYRIIKVDKMGYMYIIKENCDKTIKKNNIKSNLSTTYNDKYDVYMKKIMASKLDVITKDLYINSFINDDTYIKGNKNIWIKTENDYEIIDSVNSDIYIPASNEGACIKYVIKLKNNVVIENGDGSQLNPYTINMKNY